MRGPQCCVPCCALLLYLLCLHLTPPPHPFTSTPLKSPPLPPPLYTVGTTWGEGGYMRVAMADDMHGVCGMYLSPYQVLPSATLNQGSLDRIAGEAAAAACLPPVLKKGSIVRVAVVRPLQAKGREGNGDGSPLGSTPCVEMRGGISAPHTLHLPCQNTFSEPSSHLSPHLGVPTGEASPSPPRLSLCHPLSPTGEPSPSPPPPPPREWVTMCEPGNTYGAMVGACMGV